MAGGYQTEKQSYWWALTSFMFNVWGAGEEEIKNERARVSICNIVLCSSKRSEYFGQRYGSDNWTKRFIYHNGLCN